MFAEIQETKLSQHRQTKTFQQTLFSINNAELQRQHYCFKVSVQAFTSVKPVVSNKRFTDPQACTGLEYKSELNLILSGKGK
jgi:hypothetical protein